MGKYMITILKSMLMACIAVASSLTAQAGKVTFTAGTDTGATTVTKDGVTVSTSDMSGENYYICSGGNYLSIETADIITKVEITFTASGTANYGPSSFYGGSYVYSDNKGTWTGSASSMSLRANSEAQITKIVVTYKEGGSFSFNETFKGAKFSSGKIDGDVSGWEYSGSISFAEKNGTNGSQGVYIASTSANGTLTTPLLTNLPDVAILKFYAKNYDSDSKLTLSGTNCTLSETSFSTTNSYKEYTVIVTRGASGSPKISFSADKNKRVYLDDVTITSGYLPVTITSARYTTFCSTMATDFSSTDITVYKVKVYDGVANMTAVTDGIVPAGVGVVLYKDVEGSETLAVPVTTTDATTLADNEMVGVTERVIVSKTADGGKYNYILQSGDGGAVAFNMALEAGAYMPAGRAYLSTGYNATANGSRLNVAFTDELPSSVATHKTSCITPHAVYDLQGRRLTAGSRPRGGLVIIGGRKTVK